MKQKHQGFHRFVALSIPPEAVAEPAVPLRADTWTPLLGAAPVPLERHHHGCRWPHGDSPFFFCNEPTDGEHVYCAAHRKLGTRELPKHPKKTK